MVNLVNNIPAKNQPISIVCMSTLILAFSTKHRYVQMNPQRPVSLTVNSLSYFYIFYVTALGDLENVINNLLLIIPVPILII